MKTKIFGLNAKLALAVLAISGGLFTSCYETSDGDANVPYKPLAPVYCVSGTVTDLSTGLPLTAATVTVNSKAVTLSSGGTYFTSEGIVGENTVTVKAAGYNEEATASRKINIIAAKDGQAVTYVVDVALAPNAGTPPTPPFNPSDVVITIDVTKDITTSTKPVVLTKTDNPALDLSTGASSASYERNFDIATGAKTLKQTEKDYTTANADVQRVVNTYLGALYGYFGVYNEKGLVMPYTIVLPPLSKLTSVTALYKMTQSKFTITYKGETYYAVVKGINDCTLSTQFEYTGHAHYHGNPDHGDAINAGGGIIASEN